MSVLLGGRLSVDSPFFLAPINTGLAERGVPTPALVDFHRARAGKQIGVAYVGNIAVHPEHATNARTLHATSSSAMWRTIVDAIADAGSVPAAQLATRIAPRPPTRSWAQNNEARLLLELAEFLRSLPTQELDAVALLFGRAATTMAAHGFRVLQIHAAHGYLLSQLLSPALNTRVDEYGRDPSLLLRRCVEEARCGAPDAVIDIRISIDVEAPLALGVPDWMIAGIVSLADVLSVSAGHYDLSRELIYPARRDGENVYLERASALAAIHDSITWNCAGNIRTIHGLELGPNMTVSFGRPLIADPEFVEKSLTGRVHEIVACDWNGACHYYTRGRLRIECPLSPDLGPRTRVAQ